MLLDEEDLNLINNISENETYLEDSTDETKDHVLSLIEDVPFTELGNEEQIKLYMACRRLLFIRETDHDVLVEELNNKDRQIYELQSTQTNVPDEYTTNTQQVDHLQDEIRQLEADHDSEIQKLRRDHTNQVETINREKLLIDREKNDALRELETAVRAQSAHETGKDEFVAINDKLKLKRDELSEQIEINTKIEEENRILMRENEEMERQMHEASEQMVQMGDQYEKMKSLYGTRDIQSEQVIVQNEKLRAQVEELESDLKQRDMEADAILREVSEKTDRLMEFSNRKDQEVIKYKTQFAEMERRVHEAELAPDKRKINMLEEQLTNAKRNEQFYEDKLKLAVSDVEESNTIIERLNLSRTPQAELNVLNKKYDILKTEHDLVKNDWDTAQKRLLETERDLRECEEKHSTEAKRCNDLELGIVGLPEARQEVKKLETLLSKREEERIRLTHGIGEIDDKLTEVINENDELRAQLQLEPLLLVDISKLRDRLNIRNQSYRAENDILCAEVERLEDERIELKIQVRRAAQTSLQHAQDEGLSHDQMIQVDQFIESIKLGATPQSSISPPREKRPIKAHRNDEKYRVKYEDTISEVTKLKGDILHFKKQIEGLHSQNESFKDVIKELTTDIKSGKRLNAPELKTSPSLTRLIESLNQSEKSTDTTLVHQNDQLTGQVKLLQDQIEKEQNATKQLLIANETLRQSNVHSVVPPNDAEEKTFMVSTNYHILKDEITAVRSENTSLQQLSTELNDKITKLEATEASTTLEYEKKVESWDNERNGFEVEIDNLKLSVENVTAELAACSVNLDEFGRLRESLLKSKDDVKVDIAEAVTALTNIRIDLVKQKRIERITSHNLTTLKKKIENQKTQIASLRSLKIKEGESITHVRKEYNLQLAKLQQELELSIPKHRFDKVQTELENKCRKLRQLAEKSIEDVIAEVQITHLNEKYLKCEAEKEALFRDLETIKEKNAKLEDHLKKFNTDMEVNDEESIRSKLAILEIKELNERQKADHLSLKNSELEIIQKTQTNRIYELEKSLKALSEKTLKQADTEGTLRNALAKSIPVEVAEETKQLLKSTAEENVAINGELDKLRNLAELEESQTLQLRLELEQAGNAISNYEQKLFTDSILLDADNTATVVLLNKEIVARQDELSTTKNNLRFFEQQNDKYREQAKIAEKQVYQRDILLGILIRESHQRVSVLEDTINEYKSSYVGALPIESVERYNTEISTMREDKEKLEKQRSMIQSEKKSLQDSIGQYQLKIVSLQEMINAIRFGTKDRDLDKMQEWHKKMEDSKLVEYRSRRRLIELEEQTKALLDQNNTKNQTIRLLEDELSQRQTNLSNMSILRARHDAVIEEIQDNIAIQKRVQADAVNNVTEPPPTLPNDLQHRCATLLEDGNKMRQNLIRIGEDNKTLDHDLRSFKEKLFKKEGENIELEQVLGEYKLKFQQMGITIEQNKAIEMGEKKKIVSNAIGGADIMVKLMHLEKRAALAEAKLDSTTNELNAKHKIVERLEDRVKTAREDRRKLEAVHDEQLAQLKQRVTTDGIKRASELKETRTHLDTVINESKYTEASEVQKLSHQLDRKRKMLEGKCLYLVESRVLKYSSYKWYSGG